MKKYIIAIILGVLIASPTLAAEFETNIKFGMKHRDVTKLQEYLTDEGLYSGPISGNFFSMTLRAVKAFQTREGLPASGYVGPMTRARLNQIFELALQDTNTDEVATTGTTTSPTLPKTTDDVVTTLQSQVDTQREMMALYQQQLAEQQRQTSLLQEQVTKQQETATRQTALLEQVQTNTTPVIQPVVEQTVITPLSSVIITTSTFDDRKVVQIDTINDQFKLEFFLVKKEPNSSPSIINYIEKWDVTSLPYTRYTEFPLRICENWNNSYQTFSKKSFPELCINDENHFAYYFKDGRGDDFYTISFDKNRKHRIFMPSDISAQKIRLKGVEYGVVQEFDL